MRVVGCLLLAGFAIGCASTPESGPRRFAFREDAVAEVAPARPFRNWPVPPRELERLAAPGEFALVSLEGAGGGTTGAMKVELRFPGRLEPVPFKWKALPWRTLDRLNNAPRKELAAERVQELFLDPEDWVVPISRVLCIPYDVLEPFDAAAENRPEARCTLGLLSIWLMDVEVPELLHDPERFARDPHYARHLANLNLLTMLIEHLDGRSGNFMTSIHEDDRRVYTVDNGVAFGGMFYNWFVPNWNVLRVPALREAAISRLRKLEEDDLEEQLGVVAQLELAEDGIYRNVALGGNLDDDLGAREKDGVIQLGLTEDEIEDLWRRLEELLEAVDSGAIPTF